MTYGKNTGHRYPGTPATAFSIMTLYVALVAILNLGLGYALAVFLRRGREKVALETGDMPEETATEEWES